MREDVEGALVVQWSIETSGRDNHVPKVLAKSGRHVYVYEYWPLVIYTIDCEGNDGSVEIKVKGDNDNVIVLP
ncbi:hypothetical protein BPOR_0321g00130 [Botrytis porri]|uniref:Uncharacterized protein n=1 Tax=Botrytis porri TaxID=87229 RepID=A0A4Z1KQL8_9HELO|nr:hypothetical protein BPOR_0321g00130 [Botrytis porri]